MPLTAVKSTRVVRPEAVGPGVVLIRDGIIEGVVDKAPEGTAVLDAGTRAVSPGVVDCHVHVNEPGRTEWEGFETATRAAAAGGVTTLVDMPLNSIPVTTTRAALEAKLAAAEGKCFVDVGFWGGVVPGNTGDLADLATAGVLGCKAFLIHSGIDEFPNSTERDLLHGHAGVARPRAAVARARRARPRRPARRPRSPQVRRLPPRRDLRRGKTRRFACLSPSAGGRAARSTSFTFRRPRRSRRCARRRPRGSPSPPRPARTTCASRPSRFLTGRRSSSVLRRYATTPTARRSGRRSSTA